MYIPPNLLAHHILGKDRIEPCKYCGHFHFGKEMIIPPTKVKLASSRAEWFASMPRK